MNVVNFPAKLVCFEILYIFDVQNVRKIRVASSTCVSCINVYKFSIQKLLKS